ncbi:MAG: response regulator [Pseudomonadota bacterium]
MSEQWTVLVVDDEPDSREFVEVILKSQLPVRILSAENGEEALRLARSQRLNLIVMDMMMPGISGYDVFQTLRQDPETAAIPVIMLTGLVEMRGYMDGCDWLPQPEHCVDKPAKPEALLALARTLLATQPQT